ncbi:hypothetical protein [Pseudoalteromonas apostichopi]|uniref:hypothetical protein n=1 Tax=Pseudoalteromonas apostichopi TaxID=3035452 RepID=UPI002573C0DA|nr:hypothetical protein [Pseudoalteromonas sp. FE4]
MNIKNIFTVVILGLITLSSSHTQGATTNSAYQSTQLFIILFECILVALPTTAFVLVVWSRWKHLRFKQLLQAVLNSSLILMLLSMVTVTQLTQGLSSWLIFLAISHTLLVGINYLFLRQHSNKVKNTLTGCW